MIGRIGIRAEWLEARKSLLEQEKAATRARDALAEARRALPRVAVEAEYRFDGPEGEVGLADLFGSHSQLLIYHFMFGADWEEGCPSCSLWADCMNGIEPHMAARDTRLVMTSTAAQPVLNTYRDRMGWSLPWYTALTPAFGRDFSVSFTEAEAGTPQSYNFRETSVGQEMPGTSAFVKKDGVVYHTTSIYSRGLDVFNGFYQMLDLTAKGRDEDGFDWPMQWLRRRDQY